MVRPLWQQGAFTNISPPSRNAGFSFPPGEKNVEGPWTALGQTWREAPGEKDRPDPLTPQQVAVSNEIISRGHNPQHIYNIYSATTKVDAAGQPVLPLERVQSQKQQDLAGRIINESIAAARETRPELFTETLSSGGRSLGPRSVVGGTLPSESISPSRTLKALVDSEFSSRPTSNEILPDLRSEYPGLYGPSGIKAPLVTYGEAVDRPGGHRDTFDFSAGPPPVEAPQLLQQSGEPTSTVPIDPIQEGPGYRTNPDTGQVVDIESEMGPQYHSTIPMGYAPYDPNRQTGFFSNLGRRLMGGVTAPYRRFTDISDVPAFGSGIGAAASKFGPMLASAVIPGGGLFALLSRLIPDSGPTPYELEGKNVSDISFGPKMAWLGADVPGGGYYIPNQKVDMAQLGGGRRAGGRDITVHTPEGLVDATYRVDDTGAASITSDDFGAPDVDYGDLYYGGADYEGLDTGQFDDIYSGAEDWF